MADTLLVVNVECYAGHRGEQTPRAVTMGNRRVEVREVLDQWLAPDHGYFKVLGDDAGVYLVRHDVTADRWELTMFQRGARGST
jgi:hypothetical protein